MRGRYDTDGARGGRKVVPTFRSAWHWVFGKHEPKLRLAEKWNIPARLLDDVGLRKDQDVVVRAMDGLVLVVEPLPHAGDAEQAH